MTRRSIKRPLATRVDRLPARLFGALRVCRLPDGGLLGDISIMHEHLPPRTRLPAVHHKRTTEFVYCVSGAMTAVLGEKRRRVRAGAVLLIPPGVRHTFITGARPCDCLSVFSPALEVVPGADIHTG